jgi:hypothetical protein
MQIESLEQLISGIVLSILGVGVIIKNKKFASACKESKIKLIGEAKYDNLSEAAARFFLILIGVVFFLGGFLQIYQYFIF